MNSDSPICGIHAVSHYPGKPSFTSPSEISLNQNIPISKLRSIQYTGKDIMIRKALISTLRAFVPAYCLLMISPLLAQISKNFFRIESDRPISGISRPTLLN